jgi:hypothetical protein
MFQRTVSFGSKSAQIGIQSQEQSFVCVTVADSEANSLPLLGR